jgi:hypothetical protein
MMFRGKFHLFNSLLRYLFEIKTRDWIDLLSYDLYYIVVAGDHLVYSEYIELFSFGLFLFLRCILE